MGSAEIIIKEIKNLSQHQIRATIFYLFEQLDDEYKQETRNNFRFKQEK